MRIALPTANGALAMHFGHCEVFTIITVDETAKCVTNKEELVPPPHEPGVLPKWLGEQNVDMIIAGGMGQRAQDLFSAQNINVLVGASAKPLDELVQDYLNGALVTGENVCDH
jgi:predicted Fe-Mo cluster-binding NifX family protein